MAADVDVADRVVLAAPVVRADLLREHRARTGEDLADRVVPEVDAGPAAAVGAARRRQRA